MSSGIPWTTFLPMILMVAFGGYAIYRWVNMSKGMEPAMRSFMERTGFRLLDAHDPSVEASVAMWVANYKLQQSQGKYDVSMWRDYHGLVVTHRSFMGLQSPSSNRYVLSAWWRADVPPPRVGFHIAEKSLGGLGQRLSGMFTNMKRNFSARYGVAVTTGDPQIDGRFQIWGVDAGGIAQALQYPGLKEALLSLPEVDLYVGDEGVLFNDPQQKNLTSGMGGTLGAMAIGGNMAKMMDISINVHEHISRLLMLAFQATRAP